MKQTETLTAQEKLDRYRRKARTTVAEGVVFINTFTVALRMGASVENIQWRATNGDLRRFVHRWGRPLWFRKSDIDALQGIKPAGASLQMEGMVL